MNNKLGIHYGTFVTNWGDEEFALIKKVKKLGFDLLEMGAPWLMDQSDAQIAILKAEAAENGIKIVMSLGLSVDQDISSLDAGIRETGLNFLTGLARKMAKLGSSDCSGIVHGAWNGKLRHMDDKPLHWEQSVKTMKKAAEVFASEGVYFNVEVVNRFENFLVNDCKEAMKYLDEVDSPNLGIHLDTFHMNIEEDSMVSAIVLAGKRMRHFHIGENNRKFPGSGSMPWKTIFETLKVADYQGPIAMEPFVRPGGEVGSAVSLYRELVNLNHYEQDIMNSVAFVRTLMA